MVHVMGFSLLTASAIVLAEISICIALIDFKLMVIPDSLVAAFMCISIYPAALNQNFSQNIFGLALAFIFFIAIMLIFPGSFGGGDVKLAAAIGFYSGLSLAIVAIETALITGALFGAVYIFITKKSVKSKIPFAPFLCAGLIISMLYGNEILLLYYSLTR
jgi:leader peptidase (prepilin peptidase)/N-methyltransferase